MTAGTRPVQAQADMFPAQSEEVDMKSTPAEPLVWAHDQWMKNLEPTVQGGLLQKTNNNNKKTKHTVRKNWLPS